MMQNRPAGGVTEQKVPFAQEYEPIDALEEVVRKIKPTAIIGRSYNVIAFKVRCLTFGPYFSLFAGCNV